MNIITKIENFDKKKSYAHLHLDKRYEWVEETNLQCACHYGYNCGDEDTEWFQRDVAPTIGHWRLIETPLINPH